MENTITLLSGILKTLKNIEAQNNRASKNSDEKISKNNSQTKAEKTLGKSATDMQQINIEIKESEIDKLKNTEAGLKALGEGVGILSKHMAKFAIAPGKKSLITFIKEIASSTSDKDGINFKTTMEGFKIISDSLTTLSKGIIVFGLVKKTGLLTATENGIISLMKTIDKIPNKSKANAIKNISLLAQGLNEILSYYRRTDGSLSSNKINAIKRIWYLYRKVEKINILHSIYYMCFWSFNAVRRRM